MIKTMKTKNGRFSLRGFLAVGALAAFMPVVSIGGDLSDIMDGIGEFSSGTLSKIEKDPAKRAAYGKMSDLYERSSRRGYQSEESEKDRQAMLEAARITADAEIEAARLNAGLNLERKAEDAGTGTSPRSKAQEALKGMSAAMDGMIETERKIKEAKAKYEEAQSGLAYIERMKKGNAEVEGCGFIICNYWKDFNGNGMMDSNELIGNRKSEPGKPITFELGESIRLMGVADNAQGKAYEMILYDPKGNEILHDIANVDRPGEVFRVSDGEGKQVEQLLKDHGTGRYAAIIKLDDKLGALVEIQVTDKKNILETRTQASN